MSCAQRNTGVMHTKEDGCHAHKRGWVPCAQSKIGATYKKTGVPRKEREMSHTQEDGCHTHKKMDVTRAKADEHHPRKTKRSKNKSVLRRRRDSFERVCLLTHLLLLSLEQQ